MADGFFETMFDRMRRGAAAATGIDSLAPDAVPTAEALDGLGGPASAAMERLIATAPVGGGAERAAARVNAGTFQRTLDGDTLDLSRGKLRTPTRLAGIDAPESAQGAYGVAAQNYLDSLIAEGGGGKVDVGQRMVDRHGRDVATLYAGGKNLSLEMVRAGHARVYTDYLGGVDKKLQDALLAAQGEAQAAGLGIWQDPDGAGDPENFRRRAAGPGAAAAGHDSRVPLDPATVTQGQAVRGAMERIFAARGGAAAGGGVASAAMARLMGEVPAEIGQGAPGGRIFGDPGVGAGVGGGAQRGDYRPGEVMQRTDGWLETVLGGLDQLGNTARSGIYGMARGRGVAAGAEQAARFAGQAWRRERYTSPETLRDSLFGKVRFGKDDKQFDFGDVGDFAADLVTDLVTDPLTLLSGGVTALGKGGKIGGALAKVVPAAHEAMVGARAGLATEGAASALAVKKGLSAGIGASYGWGSTEADDPLVGRLAAAAGGAGLGYFSDRFAKGIGAALREGKDVGGFHVPGFDDLSNAYASYSRGSRFSDFATARKLALEGYDKVRNVAEWIRQGRFEALAGLEPAERIKASELMAQLKTEFVTRRNRVISKLSFPDLEGDALWQRRKTFGQLAEDQALNNQIGQSITKSMESEFVPKLLEGEQKRISEAVGGWAGHNDDVIEKLNREAFGIASGKPTEEGKGIFGLRWHVDDVYEMKDYKEAQKALGRFQIHAARDKTRSVKAMELAQSEYKAQTGHLVDENSVKLMDPKQRALWDGIHSDALDKTYGAYAENFAKKFLDSAERKASSLMFEYNSTVAKQAPLRYAEKVLAGYDKLTNFIKANMLYFSTTWIKNNYLDNLAKSWIETGVQGILDSASFGKTRAGVTKDVKELYAGGLNRIYESADMKDALARGVLDNPMYKSIEDKATRAFLYTPEQIAAVKTKNPVARLGQVLLDNPFVRLTASVGSHMEGTARMMTYVRIKEGLESSPVFKGAGPAQLEKIKDMAADVVKKTFFDYGDVSHFEKAVFQRLVPFYSFYSKNLPYWMQAALDPARAGRVVAIEKTRRNIGDEPTKFDRQGLPPYLLEQAPRKLGTDAMGNKVYGIVPGTSMHDAINMMDPRQIWAQARDKGSSLIKAGVELGTGRDLFSGGALYPSDIGREEAAARGREPGETIGKKFLYSRGFKQYAIAKASEALPKQIGEVVKAVLASSGVALDDKGNPYTTSDRDVLLDKIYSTLWPKGAIDQIVGSIGKVAVGKETVAQAMINRLAPMQQVKVSSAMERMVRNRREQGGAE